MEQSKKILITGGAGFIGSHLARHLESTGASFRILDSLSPQIHGAIPQNLDWLKDGGFEFIRGSVTDQVTLSSALDGVSDVVHLASETGTGQSMYEIARYNDTNIMGTANLLEVIANSKYSKVKRVVLASSRSVYGEGAYVCPKCGASVGRVFPKARSTARLVAHLWEPACPRCNNFLVQAPSQEEDPVRPSSIYAATKYAQEDLVRISCESLGIDYSILRLQNVYGEGQSLRNPYTGILSIFSTRIRRGLDLPIFEDGLESRDFVHVEDVVLAMHACLESREKISSVINVGSGVSTSVIDVARQLVVSLGGNSPLRITSEFRLGDIRHNVADISQLKQLMPVGPKISLAEGLNRFAAWVKTQPLPEDFLDRANDELRKRNLMA